MLNLELSTINILILVTSPPEKISCFVNTHLTYIKNYQNSFEHRGIISSSSTRPIEVIQRPTLGGRINMKSDEFGGDV